MTNYSTTTEDEVIDIIVRNDLLLEFVPEAMRTEKMCLAAVTQDGYALQGVPEEMRTEQMCLNSIEKLKSDQMYMLARGLALIPERLMTEKFRWELIQIDPRVVTYRCSLFSTEQINFAKLLY